ncbi:alanine:cation symporter family protein [Staphylococcus aureus]
MKDFDSLIPGWFKEFVHVGTDLIWSQYLIGLLSTAGFFFTISSKFVQLRMLPEMFRALVEHSEISKKMVRVIRHSKHLRLVLVRELVLVILLVLRLRLFLGGPGAVFWMWVIAFIGAASAFIEATLAQVYKVHDKDGGIPWWSSLLYY